MVEAGRRKAIAKTAEVFIEVALDRDRELLFGVAFLIERRRRRWSELVVDDCGGNDLLRVERGKAAGEIFQLAHIAGPAIALEPVYRGGLDLLVRQALTLGKHKEMTDEVRDILGTLPQWRQPQRHHVDA